MTERSRPWNGVSVGDATEAPYDAPDEWAELLRSISGAAAVPTNLSGVFRGELNALAPSGAATPVSINTGRALTYGTWYENDVATTVAIPTPSASTRIDRIVLRKSWAAQTVRITRIAGVEGGAAPPAVQIDGTTWDEPICQVSIDTGGVITLTDERQYIGGAFMLDIGSFSVGDLLYADSSSELARLAIGGAGSILITNAGATAPTWLAVGVNNSVLASTGTAPNWVSSLTLVNLTLSGTLTLTGATVSGAPTWSSAQTFPTGTTLNGTVNLASGGVLSWNAGDVTITHAANKLTFAGASGADAYNFDARVAIRSGFNLGLWNAANDALILITNTGGAGATALKMEMNGADRWEWTSTYHFTPSTPNSYDLGSSTNTVRDIYLGSTLRIGATPATTGTIRLTNGDAIHAWTGAVNVRLIDQSGGNITLGTNSFSSIIFDSAIVKYTNITTTASAANAFLDSVDANRIYRSTSSLRYKTDIGALSLSEARAFILGLKPITFESIASGDRGTKRVGFGAEDIAPLDSRFVVFDQYGAPDGVQYAIITAPLAAIAKDHDARIDSLEREVALLKGL